MPFDNITRLFNAHEENVLAKFIYIIEMVYAPVFFLCGAGVLSYAFIIPLLSPSPEPEGNSDGVTLLVFGLGVLSVLSVAVYGAAHARLNRLIDERDRRAICEKMPLSSHEVH